MLLVLIRTELGEFTRTAKGRRKIKDRNHHLLRKIISANLIFDTRLIARTTHERTLLY